MRKSKISSNRRQSKKYHSRLAHDKSNQQRLVEMILLGNSLMESENYEEASKKFAQVLEIQPRNYAALSNLGASLVKLNRMSEAQAILEYAIEINPKDTIARVNLGSVYQANQDFNNGIRVALDAVSIDPTSAVAFNNLGCAFGTVNMLPEALHAYQTAEQLDSSNLEAKLNIAMTLVELEKIDEALTAYENLINSIPINMNGFRELAKFYASFPNLKMGNFSKGWQYYESGFNQAIPQGAARLPRRYFSFPKWNGEQLNGKKIFLWREQGLGDELLFSSCLNDLVGLGAHITFECTPRLKSTFQRSFPKIVVRDEDLSIHNENLINLEGFDYHTPIGSLPKIFRKNLDSFENKHPFIKVDPEKSNNYRLRLEKYRDKKIIGISWRSGKLDPLRNREFTSLLDWGEILTMKDFIFVNLQYGDCEAEIVEAENMFGIKIIRWEDLDLKNDLDDVFALMSCLDCIITAPTAMFSMAGSLEIPTLYLCANRPWETLGVVDGTYPWYSNTFICYQNPGETAAHALPKVPKMLATLFNI